MYPIFRMIYQLAKHRNNAALSINEPHISHHLCLPSDIDPWMELNNGRTLTLYDLARVPFIKRLPLQKALRDNSWRMTMAGATIRYRRRVTLFSKIETRTRIIGHDDRFLYLQQSMYVKSEACSSGIFRAAIVDSKGIVDTKLVFEKMGMPEWRPEMPGWVIEWSKSEAMRAWPPET